MSRMLAGQPEGRIGRVIKQLVDVKCGRAVLPVAGSRSWGQRIITEWSVVRRTAENKLKVVAVRLDPAIEHRLRLLAATTRRKQSVFLQQIIERGLGAIEDAHLPQELVARIRAGELPPVPGEPKADSGLDLFGVAVSPPLRRRQRNADRAETRNEQSADDPADQTAI
ncbi:hypothetical protein V4C53_44695 [Paraburkholderia azotifigens]|uniref:hypothetical protein n=1 Tax=Paraburkholderia azotifigens TaxID=2057004 RepID=UPI00316E5758